MAHLGKNKRNFEFSYNILYLYITNSIFYSIFPKYRVKLNKIKILSDGKNDFLTGKIDNLG
jgi:hypothetical protein